MSTTCITLSTQNVCKPIENAKLHKTKINNYAILRILELLQISRGFVIVNKDESQFVHT